MENILEKSRLLVKENLHTFKLGRKVKSHHFLEYQDDTFDFFDSDFEHLYDIYKIRWEWNNEWGNYIDGLGELVQKMEQNKDLPQIRLTSFRSKAFDYLLFSNPDYTIFLGFLIFENTQTS